MKNNVIVMSEAGKPIFARYGSEVEISRLCGLFQAIRTASNGNKALNLGEIQSLHSDKLSIVFMTVASITLVSISKIDVVVNGNNNNNDSAATVVIETTEAYQRVQLEYIFAQLIFTLTEQVQNVFIHNPSFDLRTMLMSNDSFMHGILDDSSSSSGSGSCCGMDGNAGPYLVSGVQSVFPISHHVRDKASRVLQSIGGKTENTAFALLVAFGGAGSAGTGAGAGNNNNYNNNSNKILSIVQPAFRPHQIRIPDLHLILNFIGRQPGLYSSELWMPMCLPRFNSSGFLYAYTNCFDPISKLTLVLISSHNTTEQFQLFRDAATKIRDGLGIPAQTDSVLTILSTTTSTSSNNNNNNQEQNNNNNKYSGNDHDVEWTRTQEETSFDAEDDYVNVPSESDRQKAKKRQDSSSSSSSLPSPSSSPSSSDGTTSILLREVRESIELSTFENVCKEYCDEDHCSIIHFLFRVDIPVKNCSRQPSSSAGKGRLTQCISPPISSTRFPVSSSSTSTSTAAAAAATTTTTTPATTTTTSTMDDAESRRRSLIWTNYQKLSLRLRLGSATVESSMDAFDMISQDESINNHNHNGHEEGFPRIAKYCPAIGLLESPPNLHGVTYIVEETEIYLAMNGRNFELYMVTPNSISVKKAAAMGTKLVRRLMADEKKLFLATPLTWKE